MDIIPLAVLRLSPEPPRVVRSRAPSVKQPYKLAKRRISRPSSSLCSNSTQSSDNSPTKLPESIKPYQLPYVTAKAYAIYEVKSGKLLAGWGANDRREVASLTKIMTCYLSL